MLGGKCVDTILVFDLAHFLPYIIKGKELMAYNAASCQGLIEML